jgi:hypothetical protein
MGNKQPVCLAGVADGWFVPREKYCWLVAGLFREKKCCWLMADKPNEQGEDR